MSNAYEALVERIRTDNQLPMLPEIVMRLQEVAAREDSTAKELANIILAEPGITSKVLKLANSSMFRRGNQEIVEVTRAIVLLGFKRIKNIAIGLATSKTLRQVAGSGLLKEYWLHSLACAVCSQGLAHMLGADASPEEAFVAGLLHDAGKIVMAQYDPERYRSFLDQFPTTDDPLALEKELFGYDHCLAGVALAEAWCFPSGVRTAIAEHHQPRPEGDPLVNVVAISNLIAKNLYGSELERTIVAGQEIVQAAEQYLGLTEPEIDKVVSMTGYMVDELASCLEIDIDTMKKFVSTGSEISLVQNEPAPEQKVTNRNRWLKALNRISSFAIHAEQFRSFLNKSMAELSAAFEFAGCCYLKYDTERSELVGSAGSGEYPTLPRKLRSDVKLLSGPLARCVIENRPHTIHGPEAEPFVLAAGLPGSGRSLVALPVAVNGRVQGVILGMRSAGRFAEEEVQTLSTIARQFGFALQKCE